MKVKIFKIFELDYGQIICHGNHSIYRGFNCQTKSPVAIKEYINSEDISQKERQNLTCFKNLNHPNLLEILDFGEAKMPERRSASFYIVSEFFKCSLEDYLQNQKTGLQESEVRLFGKQIVNAAVEMMSQNIIFDYLNMKNMYLCQNPVKTVKIAIASLMDSSLLNLLPITDSVYFAPEVLEGNAQYVDSRLSSNT